VEVEVEVYPRAQSRLRRCATSMGKLGLGVLPESPEDEDEDSTDDLFLELPPRKPKTHMTLRKRLFEVVKVDMDVDVDVEMEVEFTLGLESVEEGRGGVRGRAAW